MLAAALLVVASIAFLHHRTLRTARRLFMTSNVYLIIAMALLAATCSHQSDLPKLFHVPNATPGQRSEQADAARHDEGQRHGLRLHLHELPGTCPMMTPPCAASRRRSTRIAPVRFVCHQRRSAARHARETAQLRLESAQRSAWLVPDGDQKTITDLSINGFKLAAGGSTSEAVLHSSKFAIADRTA